MVMRVRKERPLDVALVATLTEEVKVEMQTHGAHFLTAFAYVFGMCKELAGKKSWFSEYKDAVFKKLNQDILGEQKPTFQLTDDVIRAIYDAIRKGWLSHGHTFNQGFNAVIGTWYKEIAGNAGLREEAHIRVAQHYRLMLDAAAHERALNAPAEKD